MSFAELDRIGVTTGPGSFTGLRVGISAARGIALAAGKPAVGLTTLAAFAAPRARRGRQDRGRGRDRCPPRARLSAGVRPRRAHAGRAADRQHRRSGARRRQRSGRASSARRPRCWRPPGRRANRRRCWSTSRRAPDIVWVGTARRRRERRRRRAQAALSARARRAAAGRREAAAPMIGLLTRLFARGEPALSEAGPRDAAAIARLHAASFRRGWSDGEIERLLLERNTVAPPRHDRAHAAGLHPVAAGRRRGRNLSRSRSRRRAAAAGWRARCSTCICGGWRAWARAPCSSKSTRTTSRRGGSTGAPASARSAAGRAIINEGRERAATALVLRRDLV